MKTGLILLLLLLFSFSACRDDEEDYNFVFDVEEDFELYNNYTSINRELAITIDELNDSRCPTGAICVWQGETRVHISLDNTSADTLLLSSYDNIKDTVGGYSFELIEVNPYPELGKLIDPADYIVTIVISEIK